MKLRWHLESPEEGYLILEQPAQYRTLMISSQLRGSMRLPLPQMLFIIRYEMLPKGTTDGRSCKCKACLNLNQIQSDIRQGKLCGNELVPHYPGFYGLGLRVCAIKEPLKSFKDDVYMMPTDYAKKGLVCTNHDFDYTPYDTLPELISGAIGLWYGAEHDGFGANKWQKLKLGDLPMESNIGSLSEYFNLVHTLVPDIHPKLPKGAKLVDKDFK
jgi:hypothetical protein